jgi:hypothetical protein
MGVFSRLFSRQTGAPSAADSSEGACAPEADDTLLSTDGFGEVPHLELSQDGAEGGITETTGDSDMSKPAKVPAESAVWRAERVGSLADSDGNTRVEVLNDVPQPDVSGTQALPQPPLPASEPRARLTSDVVPTVANARAKTGVVESTPASDEGEPLLPGSQAAVDDVFSQWMTGAELDESASEATQEPAAYDGGDQRAFRDTFASIAKLHISPLRELMYHLSVGCTPSAWVTQMRPVLSPLFDAARQTGQADLLDALSELDTALELAEAENTALVGPVSRGAIQQAYARLGRHLPDTFGPPRSCDGKRLLLLEALLLQVPNVHRRVLTKLYAAGISSSQQLLQGSSDELARAAGLDRQLASSIIEHVSRFARERGGLDPVRLRARVLQQVEPLVGRLGQLQSEFERAESAGNQVRKKAVRRARDAAVLELQRLVAELGEVELIEELKRSSVRAKVVLMHSYLQRTRRNDRV